MRTVGYIREDKKYNLGEELVDKLNEDKKFRLAICIFRRSKKKK